jgi:hypothetical protein
LIAKERVQKLQFLGILLALIAVGLITL